MPSLIRFLAQIAALSVVCAPAFAQGPGLGNLTYDSPELFTNTTTPLSTINGSVGVPQGTGMVYMLNGYLFVPFAADGAGNGVSGGFALLDVSDPRAISPVFTTNGNTPYRTSTGPNYAGGIGEPHSFSLRGDIVCLPINKPGGIEFWDFSDMGDGTPADPPAPQKLSRILLPGLENSGYTRSAFAVAWQGDYAYVAGTGLGLFIVDASDPANPFLVDRGAGAPNPIPVSQLGNFPIGFVHPIGNLLTLSRTESNPGLAVCDISDPMNPTLLYSNASEDASYSTIVNGNRIYAANGKMWDLTNWANPAFIASPDDLSGMGAGGYCMVQDNYAHFGRSNGYMKADVSGTSSVTVGKVVPGVPNADYDFANAAGNLIIIGDDHAVGTPIYPHQTAPDTTGPEVNMVVPADGSINQALTSRVGLTFTDQVEVADIDSTSFIVRKVGTATPLAGTCTVQTAGVVNFWPAVPLEADASYEVVVPAGTIHDWAGNPNGTTFTSAFSTGSSIAEPVQLSVTQGTRTEVGQAWLADVVASHESGEPVEISWDFGDGSAATSYSTTTSTSHIYAAAGHYTVTVTGRLTNNPLIEQSLTFTHTVYRPLVGTPRSSATLLLDAARDRIWTANRDNDSATCIDASTLGKLFEVPVGKQPFALAQVSSGDLWVVNRGSATISVLDPTTGALVTTHNLPYASQPAGIVLSPSGGSVYVSLEATGQLLEIDTTTGAVSNTLSVGSRPRGLALSADGARLFVSRFISPDDAGKVTEVNTTLFSVVTTIDLAIDTTPDDENAGRGLPNYLGAAAVGPDNQELWIPSKKDNIERGAFRDGLNLSFENTVRPIISMIDLSTSSEVISKRIDLNDRAMPVAVTHSAIGDYVFALLQGSNAVDVIDAYSGAVITSVEDVGKAPQGVLLDPVGERLIVHNFMSRDVAVLDISGILSSTSLQATSLATISTVGSESLSPEVLLGKQIFYDGKDFRLSRDSYMNCAACHDDGGQDGRVWDFTGFGEGLRNTIALKGRGGAAGHGKVHWSGNFDEIHDFEGQVRQLNAAEGLMNDDDFNAGTRSQPLGDLKTGISSDLDALAAYLESLTEFPRSPHRQSDGSLTTEAVAGQTHFQTLDCAACHSGPQFTDSPLGQRHDVGTLTSGSGQRLGDILDGIDTPTLKDIWNTAPYLHNGSAATLADVFSSAPPATAHDVSSLSASEQDELIAYLLQIDESSPGMAETDAPTLLLTSPPHQATGVDPETNLVAIFNESVVLGTGFIRIRRIDNDAIVESFDVASSSRLTLGAADLVIDPVSSLGSGIGYYVEIESTSILDLSGNNIAAITSAAHWSFTSVLAPTSPVAAIAEFNRNNSNTAGVAGASGNTINGSGFPGSAVDIATDPDDGFGSPSEIWYVKPSAQPGAGPPVSIYYDLGEVRSVESVVIWGQNASGDGAATTIGTPTGIDVASTSGTPASFTLSNMAGLAWSTDLDDQAVLTGTGGGQVFTFASPVTTRYLRLTINSATAPDASGQYGFNEFAVLSSSSAGGSSPPALSSTTPADNATYVDTSAALLLHFDKDIQKGSGSITIHRSGTGSIVESIDVNAGGVVVTGSQVEVIRSVTLDENAAYYVNIPATAFADLSNNAYPGIGDPTGWNFTTGGLFSPSAVLAEFNRNNSDTAGVVGASGNTIDGSGFPGRAIDIATDPDDRFGSPPEIWYVKPSAQPGAGPPVNIYYDLGEVRSVESVVIWGQNASGDGAATTIGTPTGIDVASTSGTPASFTLSNMAGLAWATDLDDQAVLTGTGGGQVFTFARPVTTRYLRLTINSATAPDASGQHGFNEFAVIAPAGTINDFSTWIASATFGLDPADQGFADDPDGDGNGNGIENYFGTDPSEFSSGLVAVAASGNTFTFTHPLHDNPANDITAAYRWSTDLESFHADGVTAGGLQVDFAVVVDSGIATVTATVTGSTDQLFVRVEVNQN